MVCRRATCAVARGLFAALVLAGEAAAATEIAPGVDLLPGRFVAGTQPDGNTVILRGPAGLIVVDTGRHAEHTQAVIDFATRARQPVLAIVNTHWHLDHIGGNPRLRGAFPGVRIYASGALADAMHGFLANYRQQLQEMIASTSDSAAQTPYRSEIAILDAGPALAPDEIVTASSVRTLAGRRVRLGLESHAVTAGDVWLFDPATRVLVAGDLVTLPAPLFDTACPARWQAALEHLARVDFAVLVPGHGAPMQRAQFETYRRAFGNLLANTATKMSKEDCIAAWLHDAGTLVVDGDVSLARSLLDYYIDNSLRGDAARTASLCGP